MAFDPSGKRLAVIRAGKAEILDAGTGRVVASIPQSHVHETPAWHPSGNYLALVCYDGRDLAIAIWDLKRMTRMAILKGCRNAVVHLAFTPDGDHLLSEGWERMLRLWEWRTGRQILQDRATCNLSFDQHGRFLTLNEAGVNLVERASGGEYRSLVAQSAGGKDVNYWVPVVHPGGRVFAVTMSDCIRLFDLESGDELAAVPQQNFCTAFQANGALLTNGNRGLLRWPMHTTNPGRWQLGPPEVLDGRSYVDMASDKSGALIGQATRNGALLVRPGKGSTFLGPHGGAQHIAISPDGRYAATGINGGEEGVKLWDTNTGRLIKQFPVGSLCGGVFSPDGRWFGVAGTKGCQVVQVGTWETAFKDRWDNATFSPDGAILAAESKQGFTRLLAAASGRELARLEGPTRTWGFVAFTPDGSKLLICNDFERNIHVWDLRAVRQQLAEMDLDWDSPPLPPAPPPSTNPLQIQIDNGQSIIDERIREALRTQTVSWAAQGPKNCFVDPAHLLTDVIDFRDLAGATADEFHAWRAALPADFRLALVTSRGEAGGSLLNAVAVREKKPRPAKFYSEMTLDEGEQTWKRLEKGGLRCVLTCDYTKKGRPVTSQLWLPGDGTWSQWFGPFAFIVDQINTDAQYRRRPVFFHAPAPAGDGDYFRVNTGEAAGREYKISYRLSPDELLSAVATYPGNAWRPDVLAPYLEGGRLLFMLVVVDNHDGVDWRFRTNMSLQDYRAESAEQKRQGLFPLSLVSYRGEADTRYAAIWMRYRVAKQ
jgi:WD40 repeat protein